MILILIYMLHIFLLLPLRPVLVLPPLLGGLAVGAGPSPRTASALRAVWLERRAYLMGTDFLVRIEAPTRTLALGASESAFAAVRVWDDRLSTWRDDAEIMRLNRSRPGSPVRISDELFAVLATAEAWSARTERAFDPAVGPLIDAWGLRTGGRSPTAGDIEAALRATGMARFLLNPDQGTVVKRVDGAWIDTGGFGKGVALQAAYTALHAQGVVNGLLNFGGQVLAWGHDNEGREWTITVASPADRGRPAAGVIRIPSAGASVATSTASERWVAGGIRRARAGHILDPRSGRPIPPWGSVTVVARDPAVADILSTALFVMGPDEALAWARSHPEAGLVVVEGVPPSAVAGRQATAYLHRSTLHPTFP